jgi:hypothetical protein
MTDPRRGFVPEDEREFNQESMSLLQKAQKDILYLLEQGYPIKNASTFVGNHYMLSERQRLAIVRASAGKSVLELRRKKELLKENLGGRIFLDGLNIIITLEVALSAGTLIRCMDGTIRDLAGLRGTYRLINQTDEAILLIGRKLVELKTEAAVIYLDTPVSNTGRLKQRIQELLKDFPFQLKVELTNNVDVLLEKLGPVVTSDAIILNKCVSWYNLAGQIIDEKIIEEQITDLKILDLSQS